MPPKILGIPNNTKVLDANWTPKTNTSMLLFNKLLSLIFTDSKATALRLNGITHWVMWEMTSLFEQVGTLQDGLNTPSIHQEIQDVKNLEKPLIKWLFSFAIGQEKIKLDRFFNVKISKCFYYQGIFLPS
jgi:hypothetical protein